MHSRAGLITPRLSLVLTALKVHDLTLATSTELSLESEVMNRHGGGLIKEKVKV